MGHPYVDGSGEQLMEDDDQPRQSLKKEKRKVPSHKPDTHFATSVNKTSHDSKLYRNVKTTAAKKSKKANG